MWCPAEDPWGNGCKTWWWRGEWLKRLVHDYKEEMAKAEADATQKGGLDQPASKVEKKKKKATPKKKPTRPPKEHESSPKKSSQESTQASKSPSKPSPPKVTRSTDNNNE